MDCKFFFFFLSRAAGVAQCPQGRIAVINFEKKLQVFLRDNDFSNKEKPHKIVRHLQRNKSNSVKRTGKGLP